MLDPLPPQPERPAAALRLALDLVSMAGRLVAAADRGGWRAEWNAELIAYEQTLRADGRLGPDATPRLVWRALGAFADAVHLTAHGFGPANLVHDLGHAGRGLIKRPGFTSIAVVTLALGIGANTALFSVVRGVLLRPFPYESPERLVQLLGHVEGERPGSGNVSYPNLDDLERDSQTLASLAGLSSWRPALTEGQPLVLAGATVSWDYFETLGVRPAAGRFFLAEEEGEGRERVIVISHGLWSSRFANDPDVIGRTLAVDNMPYLVVGVAPRGFEGPHLISFEGAQPEIWRTPWFEAADWFRSGRSWKGVARLAPGVERDAAQAEITQAMTRLAEQFPDDNANRTISVQPLRDSVVGESRSALFILLGAVGLVLLVACVNVANLLIGRMLERRDELLVRSALGAARGRLLTHLFAESAAIAILGAGLGVLLAYWGVGAIVSVAGYWLPRPEAVKVDVVVLAFSLAIAAGTALMFGLLPALRVLGGTPLTAVSGSRPAGGPGAGRIRRALVLGQIATSVVLVVGAGLLLQTFYNLHGVDLGVARGGVITLDMHYSAWSDLEEDVASVRYRDLLDRVTGLPGVEAAGAIDMIPLADNYSCDGVTPLDRPPPTPGEGRCAEVRSATPGALEALGASLIEGRLLEWRDDPQSAGRIVITRRAAEVFWPEREPLGRRALIHGDTFEVVGVVSDIRHFGPESDLEPMVFIPSMQEPWNGISRGLSIVARGDDAVEGLGPELRAVIAGVDPNIAIERIRPIRDLLAARVGGPRLRASLLLVFALLALTLALVGIAGVMAQAVTRRRRELGIRLALGAAPSTAMRIVLGEGARITVLGLVVGLVAASGLTRLLSGFVYGVTPLEPRIVIPGTVLVCGLSLLASWLPARRAARIDPVEALRAD